MPGKFHGLLESTKTRNSRNWRLGGVKVVAKSQSLFRLCLPRTSQAAHGDPTYHNPHSAEACRSRRDERGRDESH